MLIANMIGRNEADRYLVDALKHLSQIVDLIVFTDDSSTDATAHIAHDFDAKVMITDRPLFHESEYTLRTLAWRHLSSYASPGDWVLAIDCDEKLYGYEHLPVLMDQSRYDVLGITFYHMWDDNHYRVDKAWAPCSSHRLFRYYRGGQFKQRKLACGSEPMYVQQLSARGRFLPHTPLRMKHLGYLRDEDKLAKHKRYMELDGGEFHARTHLDSILDPNPTLRKWTD